MRVLLTAVLALGCSAPIAVSIMPDAAQTPGDTSGSMDAGAMTIDAQAIPQDTGTDNPVVDVPVQMPDVSMVQDTGTDVPTVDVPTMPDVLMVQDTGTDAGPQDPLCSLGIMCCIPHAGGRECWPCGGCGHPCCSMGGTQSCPDLVGGIPPCGLYSVCVTIPSLFCGDCTGMCP